MYDLIIVGGGPSGLSCALYGARGGLKVLLIEKMSFGGQMNLTDEIQNYPGFSNVHGYELSDYMANQAMGFGAECIFGEVVKADYTEEIKSVTLSDGKTYQGKALVFATGAKERSLGVEDEEKYVGRGVSYCATCDGRFYKKKTVAIVGGGDTAVADAVYLNRIASKVILIHRRDTLRSTVSSVEKLREMGIDVILKSQVIKLVGDDVLRSVVIKGEEGEAEIKVDGLFVAVGRNPESHLFADLTKNGYAQTDEKCESKIKNVFIIGDVREKTLRQVVTAAGDGAIAGETLVRRKAGIE